MSRATLAFVIPAFNAEDSLAATIESAQACEPQELVVVDDGSTDRTVEVARQAGARVVQQANAGAAAARRRGLEEVSGDLVVMLDADDFVVPAGVARSVEVLTEDPAATAALGVALCIPKDGQEFPFHTWEEGVTAESLVRRGHAPVPPAAITYRTSAMRRAMSDEPAGVWPRRAEDYELLIRMSLLGPVLTHDEPSARYRIVGGKSSANVRAQIQDSERIRRHYLVAAGVDPSEVPEVGRRQLNSLVARRRALEVSGNPLEPRRVLLTVGAALLDPQRLVTVARRRVGQLVPTRA